LAEQQQQLLLLLLLLLQLLAANSSEVRSPLVRIGLRTHRASQLPTLTSA
jgi:hypothetical protein